MSDSANQPMSAQACYSKRNTFKESLDEIGARIVEHVQAKGSHGELLIHLDYLKSFFEKALSWHKKAISCPGGSNQKNARLWENKLEADYKRYHDSANSYLTVTEEDSHASAQVPIVPDSPVDPSTQPLVPPQLNTNQGELPQANAGQGQFVTSDAPSFSRRLSLLGRKRADAWISYRNQHSLGFPSLPGRLPKMELPKFYGDPREWLKFAAAFNTLVHSNSNDNAYRMAMLQQSLSPSVQQSIATYLVDPEFYPVALSELQSIYGDPTLIAETYLDELASLKAVPDNDPVALRTFSYKLSAILAGLINEDFHQDLSASTTLSLLASKLPPRLRSKWTKRTMKMQGQNVRPNIEHFVDCLKEIAAHECRNSSIRILPARDFPEPKKPRLDIPQQKGKSLKPPKAKSYAISTSASSSAQCLACDGEHDSSSCNLYTRSSLDDRVSKVREKRACYRCLSRSHRCSDCPNKDPCGVDGCKKAHHPSIHGCGRIFPKPSSNPSSSQQASA
jgi:Protein of unknown function (DUF1759)